MGFELDRKEQTCVIRVKGKLDIRNIGSFNELVQSGCDPETKKMVIDLHGLTFVDSTGLVEMIHLIKKIFRLVGKVDLVNNRLNVCQILVLSGLGDIINIHLTMEKALEVNK